MRITREQLATMLGVSIKGLCKIQSRGTLEDRLNRIGYKLIKKYREGRKNVYILH